MNTTKRKIASFIIEDEVSLLNKVLSWSKNFELFSLLNSNNYLVKNSSYNWLVGAGGEVLDLKEDAFLELNKQHNQDKDWLFGCLPYDLKNDIEALESKNQDRIGFERVLFFKPEVVLRFNENLLYIETIGVEPKKVFKVIFDCPEIENKDQPSIRLKPTYSKEEYVSKIKSLQEHIQQGDIYEVNFCQEFFAEDVNIDSVEVYKKLNNKTRAPFSTFFKVDKVSVLSGSPERYLAKKGTNITSQPIKGTAKRSVHLQEDTDIKNELLTSVKERAENVMIVDLVRNDLSRTAINGSVEVEELFGVYSFPTVHQLISTIVSKIDKADSWGETMKNTFPMGSMTGAPKVSAMKLIEEFEDFKRGVYSGAIGYISPNGDFDFNVVIRSIIYNQETRQVSAPVGGAITILSDPEKEYEECLLKVKALKLSLE